MSSPSIEAVSTQHAAGVEIAPHAHGGGQLIIALRGTAIVMHDEGAWLAPPGLGIWVPPNVVHSARYSESSDLINLQLGGSWAAQLSHACGSLVVSDLLRELARETVRLGALARPDPALDLLAQLIVLQIKAPKPGPMLFVPHGRDRRLQIATRALHENPGQSLTLDGLAGLSHTSARTLARLFVAETGMTFGRWREHLRIVHAVDRLARGWSITQTALDLGYQSASSFTTLFTRLLGAPPRRYMQEFYVSKAR
ncbi:MAG TPA: helix-turn-helix transcriptional regulator [Bordetella sp.]